MFWKQLLLTNELIFDVSLHQRNIHGKGRTNYKLLQLYLSLKLSLTLVTLSKSYYIEEEEQYNHFNMVNLNLILFGATTANLFFNTSLCMTIHNPCLRKVDFFVKVVERRRKKQEEFVHESVLC